MAKTPTSSITEALGSNVRGGATLTSVAQKVRKALTRDGWRVVKANKVTRLEEVLNEIYVDSRRQRQVELLDEARKLAQSL